MFTPISPGPPPDPLVALLTGRAESWERESKTIETSAENKDWTLVAGAYGQGYRAALDRCARDLRKDVAEIEGHPGSLIDRSGE